MVDSGAVAVVKSEGEGFRGGIEVNEMCIRDRVRLPFTWSPSLI